MAPRLHGGLLALLLLGCSTREPRPDRMPDLFPARDSGALDLARSDAARDAQVDATVPDPWIGYPQNLQGGGLRGIWGSGTDVFAVGLFGMILHSPDSGKSWERQNGAEGYDLSDIWGSGLTDIYAVGGITPSPDFGLPPDGGFGPPPPVAILHTIDGGKSWQVQTSPAVGYLFGAWGRGPGDVYAVGGVTAGSEVILHTLDGGRTWRPTPAGTQESLREVWGTVSHLFVVGNGGTILRSADGGQTWEPRPSGTTQQVRDIWGVGVELYAVTADGLVLHTLDAGTSWSRLVLPIPQGQMFSALWGPSAGEVYVLGSFRILHTVDHGQSWVREGPNVHLKCVWGSGPNNVWAADRDIYHRR